MIHNRKNVWALADLQKELEVTDQPFHCFLDNATMKIEIYEIPVGVADLQKPHDLDELYYVAAGRSKLESASGTVDVEKGDTIFVQAHEPHRFLDVTKDLTVIVFFSKKEPLS